MTDDDPLARSTAGVPTLVSLYFAGLNGRPPKRAVARRVLEALAYGKKSHGEIRWCPSSKEDWVDPTRDPMNSGKVSAALRELGGWHLVSYTHGRARGTRIYEITELGRQVIAFLKPEKKPAVHAQSTGRTTTSSSRITLR